MRINLLLREKPARLLLALRPPGTLQTVSGLAKSAGMSFVHTSNLVAGFSDAGLVETSRSGREKRVKLTPRGLEVAAALELLMAKIAAKKEAQPGGPAEESGSSPPLSDTEEAAFPEPPPQEKKE